VPGAEKGEDIDTAWAISSFVGKKSSSKAWFVVTRFEGPGRVGHLGVLLGTTNFVTVHMF